MTIDLWRDIVSIGGGILLLWSSVYVCLVFWPKGELRPWKIEGAVPLIHSAIFWSFVFHGINTAFWQLWGNLVVEVLQIQTASELRSYGLFIDGFLKGGAALTGVMHLEAIRRQLPDRDEWKWYQMPWHPERRSCVDWLLARLGVK